MANPVNLSFVNTVNAARGHERLLIVGSAARIEKDGHKLAPELSDEVWAALTKDLTPGDTGSSRTTYTGTKGTERVTICVLPKGASRHCSPSRSHFVHDLVGSNSGGDGDLGIICLLDDNDHAFATGLACARPFPLFDTKTQSSKTSKKKPTSRTAHIALVGPKSVLKPNTRIVEGANSVRLTARLVDSPCAVINTTTFTAEAKAVAKETGTKIRVIKGETLRDQGFGGLWNVGKGAEEPPALVIMTYTPEKMTKKTKHVVWVGKGMVYDTGGLNIKVGGHMAGMKTDMGGAAAMLGAFRAAALAGVKQKVTALLCLAENAVDAASYRPDDIITHYSGKTVEVDNTDAEGRLVMADGLGYAAKKLNPDYIVDMATLTGAQLVATGKRHAALYCNDGDLEEMTMKAGRYSGDLAHPLPYAPEFFRKDYKSAVADLRNTTKDRMNASSASAGQFLKEHLVDFEGPHLHVDIAGPCSGPDRATGYGVGLLLEMLARS